jgi:uncharacterized Zn-finger protein
MTASRFELLDEITSAGGCSHPVRLRGEFVNTVTGEVNQRQLRVACKDRRAVICSACSHLYQADAWIMVSAGLVGGKGVPASVLSHPRVFMTLTAPSFGPVHTKPTARVIRSRRCRVATASPRSVRRSTTMRVCCWVHRSAQSALTTARQRCGMRSPHDFGIERSNRCADDWLSAKALRRTTFAITPDSAI